MAVSEEIVTEYDTSGVVLLPSIFESWVSPLRKGIEAQLCSPGPNASEHVSDTGDGRFFEEYLSWDQREEYRSFIFGSGIGEIAAQMMRSDRCQLFADHVFVKEPGTTKRTTWHQDASYSPFVGIQSTNAWVALDPVTRRDGLHFVVGSHLWGVTLPTRSFTTGQRYEGSSGLDPDTIDIHAQKLVSWDLAPGDVLFFDSRILHGTMEEQPLTSRRRAFCVRMVGDDVRYSTRPGIPPFPWTGLVNGQRLPEDFFPVLFAIGS